MSQENARRPTLAANDYFKLHDELERAEQDRMRAEERARTLRLRIEEVKEELHKSVYKDNPRRHFLVGDQLILVSQQPDGTATLEVLACEKE